MPHLSACAHGSSSWMGSCHGCSKAVGRADLKTISTILSAVNPPIHWPEEELPWRGGGWGSCTQLWQPSASRCHSAPRGERCPRCSAHWPWNRQGGFPVAMAPPLPGLTPRNPNSLAVQVRPKSIAELFHNIRKSCGRQTAPELAAVIGWGRRDSAVCWAHLWERKNTIQVKTGAKWQNLPWNVIFQWPAGGICYAQSKLSLRSPPCSPGTSHQIERCVLGVHQVPLRLLAFHHAHNLLHPEIKLWPPKRKKTSALNCWAEILKEETI